MDANGNGQITPQEFEMFYGKDSDRFKKVDVNENGLLTHDEYHEALGHGTL